jgi:hypothetical protein
MEFHMNKIVASALVSIGFLTVPLAYSADFHPQQQHRARHDGQARFSLPSERTEARLASLKSALKITTTQEAQWGAYADTERRLAAARDAQVREWRAQSTPPSKRQKRTAIAQLESRQNRLAAAAVSLNERLAAIRPLYAALSDEQKLLADDVLVRSGRGHFHRRGGRASA